MRPFGDSEMGHSHTGNPEIQDGLIIILELNHVTLL